MRLFEQLKQKALVVQQTGKADKLMQRLQALETIRDRGGCPDLKDLDDYAAGTMSLGRRISIAWHKSRCERCLVEILALRGGFKEQSAEEKAKHRRKVFVRAGNITSIGVLLLIYLKWGIGAAIAFPIGLAALIMICTIVFAATSAFRRSGW